jgi:hypothetical protein
MGAKMPFFEKMTTSTLAVAATAGLLAALYLFSYPNNLLPSGDTAEYWNNAYRVLRGELPYRDFWLLFPPGEAYLPAAIYAVFGLTTTALPTALKALEVLAVVLSAAAARQFAGAVAALWVAFMVLARYDAYDHVYLIPLLGAFILVLRSLDSEGRWPRFFAGLLVGVAFQLRFELAAVFAVGAVFALAVGRGGPNVASKARLRAVSPFVLAFALAVALELFAFRDDLGLFLNAVFLDSVRHGTSMNLPFLHDVWAQTQLLDAASMALRLFLPFLLGGAAVWALASRQLTPRDAAICLLLLIWLAGILPKALGRSDAAHFVHAWFPAYLLLPFLRTRANAVFDHRMARLCWVSGLTALALVLTVDDVRFTQSRWRWLHAPYYTVQTPMGAVTALDEGEAERVRALVAEVERTTAVGEPIFVIPWGAPPLYALTKRINPTYYDSLIDVMVRPSLQKQERLCAELRQARPKLIVHYTDLSSGFDHRSDFEWRRAAARLQQCIENAYALAEVFGSYAIYWPKAAGATVRP